MIKDQIKRAVAGIALTLAIGVAAPGWLATGRNSSPPSAQEPKSGEQAKPAAPSSDEKPAEEVFKNIRIFKGLPASRVKPAMTRISGFLGVQCNFCHVKDAFEKDDLEPKQTARMMFQLVRVISRELKSNSVTCFTCHQGHTTPERPPEAFRAKMREEMDKAKEDTRPADSVYKNLQVLKSLQAGQVKMTMSRISRSLGVDCAYCHVPEAFERDDKPAKQSAREMLRMVDAVRKEPGLNLPLSCYVCHRGATKPVSLPPAATPGSTPGE